MLTSRYVNIRFPRYSSAYMPPSSLEAFAGELRIVVKLSNSPDFNVNVNTAAPASTEKTTIANIDFSENNLNREWMSVLASVSKATMEKYGCTAKKKNLPVQNVLSIAEGNVSIGKTKW